MTIDLRANISCSLGPIISGNISDDYLQGSGLVKVSGDVELSGIFTPATGTVVTFSYTKSGITRSIPRKLRVLGSFADPFRRITKVSLGCKLTYLSDLKEPIDWTAFDDPENDDYTSADAEIITIPIRASSIMNKCLAELGITASGNPLTNKFSIESFDFSSGYVSILSDLLVSESYCGHLDQNEVLQIFSLDEEGGTGPVINSTKIIDLDATNFGQLPGEAVTVSYSTLRLKRDINIDDDDGNNTTNAVKPEEDTFESVTREEVITYQDFNGTQQFKLYPVFESTKVTTTSRSFTIRILSPLSSGNYYIISGYERVRKVVKRVTEEETSSVTVEGGLVSNYLKNGEYYYPSQVKKTTTETFEYDAYGNEKFYQRVVLGTQAHLVGTFGVQEWCFSSPTGLLSVAPGRGQNTYLELEKRWTKTTNDFQRVRTQTFGPWTSTIAGQQAIAEGFKNISTYLDLLSAISYCSSRGLALIDSRVTSRRISEGEVGPSTEATNNANNADGGDPNNGYRTESVSELELALGSPTAQRRIEFSLPYAPDDIFIKTADGYTSVPSDAPQKAAKYGRVQNRLLLGNRSGMNLQLEPEIFPTKPFSPIMVQANGLSALYRVNGTNWQLSAEGLLVSTDALFWGAIGGTGGGGTGGGGTGDYWFPVAPGVVSLPSTPPVVDGSMTVTTVVPPWNETVVTTGSLRVGLTILSLAYPLELLTEVSLSVRTPLTYNRLQRFIVPSPPGITNASLSPKIDQSLAMRTPGIDISVNANVPQVGSQVGVFVIPPLGDSTVSALAPRITGSLDVRPIAVDFAITANVPVVGRFVGVYIDPGVANTIISGLAPTISGPSAYNLNVYPPATDTIISALLPSVEGTYSLLDLYPSAIDTSIGCLVPVVSAQSEDPYYSSVSLLLHMDGSNNSTTFADSSTNTLAIAANGNAKISTAQSKFGVASAYFDGTGDYLSSNYSTSLDLIGNDFTVECWLYIETIKAVGSRVASCGGGTVAFNSTNGIHWLLDVLPSGVLRLAVRNTSGAGYGEVATSLTISVNTWTHIAACVSGSTGYVSVNGTVVSASLGTLQRPSTDPLLGIATIPGEVGGVTTALQGYIDDLRITKGVARYTSSFIPPTAPFVNVGPIYDPNFSDVSLLLHMDGSNGSTTFIEDSSNVLTVTANGNAQISTAQSKFNGASGYFDGLGDFASISSPSSSLINWWTGNFTVEYWIRAAAFTQTGSNFAPVILGNMSATTTLNYWSFGPIANGTVRFYYYNGAAVTLTTATALSTNTWYHLAFVKNGAALTIYIDGVSSATGTVSGTPQSSGSTTFCIGQNNNFSFNGYLDDIRITSGVARYAANFTPPIAAFPNTGPIYDPNFYNVSLLLHMDGSNGSTTFTDSSSNAAAITVNGNASLSTAVKRYGVSSGAFDGAGDYISVTPSSAFEFGTGDFTIEAWTYLVANNIAYPYVFSVDHASGSVAIRYGDSGYGYKLQVQVTGTTVSTVWSSAVTQATYQNQWVHIAYSRAAGTNRLFVNGILQSLNSGANPSTYPVTSFNDATSVVSVSQVTAGVNFNGYIDDIRVTKGFARYTANFAPPIAAFPDIGPIYDPNFSNVSLLLHMDGSNGSTSFIDNSINSLAVTANGNAQISTAQNKFGGASAAFDGAGDYLSVAANTLTDLPGDFTIECWAYFNSLGVAQTLLGKWGNTNRAWLFSVDSATQLTFALGNNGGYSTLFSRAMSISTNTWNHFAVCRAGTTIYQFVNGVQAGATGTSSANCSATQVTAVGINTDGNVYSVNGYIDEARITKGVARYTSNFTPPTVAFPND